MCNRILFFHLHSENIQVKTFTTKMDAPLKAICVDCTDFCSTFKLHLGALYTLAIKVKY